MNIQKQLYKKIVSIHNFWWTNLFAHCLFLQLSTEKWTEMAGMRQRAEAKTIIKLGNTMQEILQIPPL